jgi:ketosteroid isomerase-like protein
MPKPRSLIPSCLMLTLTLSCQGKRDRNHQAETQLLRERSAAIVAAEASKNIDTVLTYYAEDAVIHPPTAPVAKGHSAIRQLYADFYRTVPFASFTASITSMEVAGSGDLAFETGVNRFGFDSAGTRTEDIGKYLTVWRKLGGEWKIAAVAFSPDHP